MKTIIFQSVDGDRVEVKADIFATNTELQQAGFDTRFTAMEIIDNEAAIAKGINITEIEQSWVGIKDLAGQRGLSVTIIDINDKVAPKFTLNYIPVTSVTMTPATVSKANNTTQQFVAVVAPAQAPQAVYWSIQSVSGLSINQSGLVTIGTVAAGTYTVTCKSVQNQAILDTSALTVTV